MTDASPALDGNAQDVRRATAATDPSPATGPSADALTDRDPPSWDEVRSLRTEAKNHRLARRAAESERDALRGRVDAHDRSDVERQLADRLAAPGDIWLAVQLADLRDEDGQLDQEKINDRTEQVLADRPHWSKTSRPDFSSGARTPIKPPKSIGSAFKQALGGGQ